MKKIVKYISICLLVLFSFYYTNLVSQIFINNSPIMKSINEYKMEYEEQYVNAVINNTYIIPGINGIEVDKLNSYYEMKKEDAFNKDLFVLKEIKPETSYYNHLDLIITKGNPVKNSISILVNNNIDILKYLKNNKIVFNRLVDIQTVLETTYYQQINNDFLHYEEVEKVLDNNKNNTNICIVNNDNIEFCKDYGKYLVKPIIVKNNDYLIYKNIESGAILLIDDNLSLSKFKLLLKRISFLNLNIVYLDYLISESR